MQSSIFGNAPLRAIFIGLPAYAGPTPTPSYFMLLEFENGSVASIRDFKYVPYIAEEAEFEEVG